MKYFYILIFILVPSISYSAQEDITDDELYISTQTTNEENNDESGEIISQESKEDIINFVEDYIKKDINLKGAFFIEDKISKKILKLNFVKIKEVIMDEKKVITQFKDSNSKLYEINFFVSGLWGNLDIIKININKNNSEEKKDIKKENNRKSK